MGSPVEDPSSIAHAPCLGPGKANVPSVHAGVEAITVGFLTNTTSPSDESKLRSSPDDPVVAGMIIDGTSGGAKGSFESSARA